MFVPALRGGVPVFELATAAHVGNDKSIPLFEPVAADAFGVVRRLGFAEAAVGVNQRRRVGRGGFADVEIRYPRAVGRLCPKLLYFDAVCNKLFGLAAQHAQFVDVQIEGKQGERGGEIVGGQIEHVAAPGLVGDFQRACGQLGQALFFPCFARPFPRFQTAFHVIQQRHGDKAFGGFHAVHRLRVGRLEQQRRLAQHAFVQLHRHQRARRIALVCPLPRLAQLHKQLACGVADDVAVARQFEFDGAVVGQHLVIVFGEKAFRRFDQVDGRTEAVEVAPGVGHHPVFRHLQHGQAV